MYTHHKYSLMLELGYVLCCVIISKKKFLHRSRLKTLKFFFLLKRHKACVLTGTEMYEEELCLAALM